MEMQCITSAYRTWVYNFHVVFLWNNHHNQHHQAFCSLRKCALSLPLWIQTMGVCMCACNIFEKILTQLENFWISHRGHFLVWLLRTHKSWTNSERRVHIASGVYSSICVSVILCMCDSVSVRVCVCAYACMSVCISSVYLFYPANGLHIQQQAERVTFCVRNCIGRDVYWYKMFPTFGSILKQTYNTIYDTIRNVYY